MSQPADLDKAAIPSLFFRYYTPALTSMLSVTIHQVINGIILGRYVGKEGVGAIGLYGPVLILFIAFSLALMIGGGILIAQNIGARDYTQAQQVFRFSTTIALVIGGMIAASAPFTTGIVAGFLAGEKGTAIYQSTYDYTFWGFLWLPLFFLRMLWGNAITNDGAPKVSKNATLISVVLNIIFDIILVIFIPLGTAGASIATGLAFLGALVYLYSYLRRGNGHLDIHNFHLQFRFHKWKELIRFGIPSFISEISFALGLLLINKSLIPFGSLTVAAFGMVNHISFIFIRLFTSVMISVLPIMSFNIGAGQPARVLKTLKFALLFTTAIGLAVTVIGQLFPGFLLYAFAGAESAAYQATGVHAIRMYFILFLTVGSNYVLGAYFQSTGYALLSTIINLLKGFIMVVIFLWLLPGYFQMGLTGVWLSRSFAEAGTLLLIGLLTLFQKERYYSSHAILRKRKTE